MENPILVLLVEDQQIIALTVEEAFTAEGFRITSVPSGIDAIRELAKPDMEYRALVTDIHVKDKLTGWEIATRAREIAPEIPVVYMTGAEVADWTEYGVPNSILVTKPFASEELVTAVSQLLKQSNTPAKCTSRPSASR